MFINIEIDWNWTVGLDWHKKIKGFRLGFVAIHFIPMSLEKFIELNNEKYHKDRLNQDACRGYNPEEFKELIIKQHEQDYGGLKNEEA